MHRHPEMRERLPALMRAPSPRFVWCVGEGAGVEQQQQQQLHHPTSDAASRMRQMAVDAPPPLPFNLRNPEEEDEDDDDDDDEDEDDDEDDEESGDDDDEEDDALHRGRHGGDDNDSGPTPTNETTASDEFEWLPPAALPSKRDAATATTSDGEGAGTSDSCAECQRMSPAPPPSSSSHWRQRREDYLVVGGEDVEPKRTSVVLGQGSAEGGSSSVGRTCSTPTSSSGPSGESQWSRSPMIMKLMDAGSGSFGAAAASRPPPYFYPAPPSTTLSLDRRHIRAVDACGSCSHARGASSPLPQQPLMNSNNNNTHLQQQHYCCHQYPGEGVGVYDSGDPYRRSMCSPAPRQHTRLSPAPSPIHSRSQSPASWSDLKSHSLPCERHRRRRRSHGKQPLLNQALPLTSLPPPSPPSPCGSVHYSCVHHCHSDHFLMEYMHWKNFIKSNGLLQDCDELQDKLHRLEGDKDNLSLQVNVLTEQIEVQSDKIRDLENLLHEKRNHLDNAEAMLQRELMTRSSLETQKLDLMTEISNLKLRLAAVEREKLEMESRARQVELELTFLRNHLIERENEVAALRSKAGRSGFPSDSNKTGTSVLSAATPVRLQRQQIEVEKLRKTLETVVASNVEKDQKIEELCTAISRYKRVQELIQNNQIRKSDSATTEEEDTNDSASTHHKPSQHGTAANSSDGKLQNKASSQYNRQLENNGGPAATSTPIQGQRADIALVAGSTGTTTQPSPLSIGGSGPASFSTPATRRTASAEEIPPLAPRTPPPRMWHGVHMDPYGTIPRNYGNTSLPSAPESYRSLHNTDLDNFRVRQKSMGLSFGKALFRLKTGKRSRSAPNLVNSESVNDSTSTSGSLVGNHPSPQKSPLLNDPKQKNKGLRRFFGKLTRSNSQHLDRDGTDGAFQRGGIRATAGARLAWTKDLKSNRETLEIPFTRWDGDRLGAWLNDIGLTMYIGECKRWVKNGEQLLRATNHDLEKDLGIKNPLHRKKLLLALQTMNPGKDDKMGSLDYHWVTRWLDDVGLPQYKDTFGEARVDGRVLNCLTVEDIMYLKVSNLLHHLSLKRGIHVLRLHNFDPSCLKRRPSTDEQHRSPTPEEVSLWTNHRVMEWLRSVDLSEYAPNLRGSGVHGALMVYEPRFNAELLATLLFIPASKTLLRRHLNTHFKQLVGCETVQQKRDCETSPGYVPLTPNTKVKASRRGQFTLMRKKSKNEMDLEDYICPLSESSPLLGERKLKQEGTKDTENIQDMSQELSSLTTKLQEETLLSSMTATNV